MPWKTSHITGSPEPPSPYRLERVFPKLEFKNPLVFVQAPGMDRFFVAEQAGPSDSFKPDPLVAKADLFIDLSKEIHSWGGQRRQGRRQRLRSGVSSEFAKNRYCYICYILSGRKPGDSSADGTRISRFTRDRHRSAARRSRRAKRSSSPGWAAATTAATSTSAPTASSTSPPATAPTPTRPTAATPARTSATCFSSILRIDVDREETGKPYAIPPDNPFVKTPAPGRKFGPTACAIPGG